MKLYSWNVNGIRAVLNKGAFQSFIAEHQPDILCLQETKAKEDQADVDLPDYHKYWNSADKAGYSGTAIFSKVKPLQVINGFTDDIAAKAQADTMANTAILQSGLAGMNDWWTPAETFGKALVNKEITKDNAAAKYQDWVKQAGGKIAE